MTMSKSVNFDLRHAHWQKGRENLLPNVALHDRLTEFCTKNQQLANNDVAQTSLLSEQWRRGGHIDLGPCASILSP